ncbi:MAG: methionyl-tRNA formyltransferase [Rubrivivax sp.]|nr:methionyl-tRNA formyltransferase [Rubrivivax sp.]
MRLAFAGTPEFARAALAALHAAGHEIVLVLTQPDRPAGRGMKLQPSPVKQFALQHGLALAQPRSLRLVGKWPDDAAAARAALQQAAPDVMVVAAYGLILPAWVLALPPRGCLNIHASLLPRWRGAAPIQRAIEAGDATTGITIMQMDEGLDTGDLLLAEALAITPDDSAATLHDRLAALGARLVVQALARMDELPRRPQPAEGITYAHKIDKAEGQVDWSQPAALIERRLRAFDPFPGLQAEIAGEPVKLWRGRVAEGQGAPGERLAAAPGRLLVACGDGALELLELQRPGGRRITAREFLQRARP